MIKWCIVIALLTMSVVVKAILIEEENSIYKVDGDGGKTPLFLVEGTKESGVTTYSIEAISPDYKWAVIISYTTAIGSKVSEIPFLYNIENDIVPHGYRYVDFNSKFIDIEGELFFSDKRKKINVKLKYISLKKNYKVKKNCFGDWSEVDQCKYYKLGTGDYVIEAGKKSYSVLGELLEVMSFPNAITYTISTNTERVLKTTFLSLNTNLKESYWIDFKNQNIVALHEWLTGAPELLSYKIRNIANLQAYFKKYKEVGASYKFNTNVGEYRVYTIMYGSIEYYLMNYHTWEIKKFEENNEKLLIANLDKMNVELILDGDNRPLAVNIGDGELMVESIPDQFMHF